MKGMMEKLKYYKAPDTGDKTSASQGDFATDIAAIRKQQVIDEAEVKGTKDTLAKMKEGI